MAVVNVTWRTGQLLFTNREISILATFFFFLWSSWIHILLGKLSFCPSYSNFDCWISRDIESLFPSSLIFLQIATSIYACVDIFVQIFCLGSIFFFALFNIFAFFKNIYSRNSVLINFILVFKRLKQLMMLFKFQYLKGFTKF